MCETHHGHQLELGHLRISHETRMNIASMLLQGVTSRGVLDAIRNDSNSGISRDHLITLQDINNIGRQYNINGIQRHANDQTSVAIIVEELRGMEYDPVLLFKAQGVEQSAQLDNFALGDFALGIQTMFQRDMMCKFGSGAVCMDSTFGTNTYDFYLTTVLVVDEYGEGILVAWLVTNRENTTTLTQFLESVKKQTGPIAPTTFMSDDAEQYYTAWVGVFGRNETAKLLCSWHVDRAWKKTVQETISQEDRTTVYHHLRILLEETDEREFRKRLQEVLSYLQEKGHQRFLDYFQRYYVQRTSQWASCYRQGKHVNTNMYVESFHRLLKVVYLDSKQNRRVDHLIHILLKIARDKVFERMLKVEKGKNTHRLCEIHKRHEKAVQMLQQGVTMTPEVSQVEENIQTWKVQANTGNQFYYTVQLEMGSNCTDCMTSCSKCSICPHQCTCTCLDATVHHTVCKHVHAVVIQHVQNDTSSASGTTESVAIGHSDRVYFEAILGMETEGQSFKSRVRSQLNTLSGVLESTDDESILKSVHTQLKSVIATFSIQNAGQQFSPPTKAVAPNTKIISQPRFQSTRKQSSRPSKVMGKPTEEQTHEIKAKLRKQDIVMCGKCFRECSAELVDTDQWVECEHCACWYHQACVQFSSYMTNFTCDSCQ